MGWSVAGLNQLDNFINCWLYYMDKDSASNGTYVEVCENAELLAENGLFEDYAFSWSILTSVVFLSSIPGNFLFPVSDKYGRIPMMKIACVFCVFGTICQAVSFFVESYRKIW